MQRIERFGKEETPSLQMSYLKILSPMCCNTSVCAYAYTHKHIIALPYIALLRITVCTVTLRCDTIHYAKLHYTHKMYRTYVRYVMLT